MANTQMFDLNKASGPIQRAAWARQNVRIAQGNLSRALDELATVFLGHTEPVGPAHDAAATIEATEVYTDSPEFNSVTVLDKDRETPSQGVLKRLAAEGLIQIADAPLTGDDGHLGCRITLTAQGQTLL